jgi:hypothetical protein
MAFQVRDSRFGTQIEEERTMKRLHYSAASSILTALALATILNLVRSERGAEVADPQARSDEDKLKAATSGFSATDDQAIRQASAAYTLALNKGETDGIMAFWSPDADYVDEAGKMTRGRAAIAGLSALSEESAGQSQG